MRMPAAWFLELDADNGPAIGGHRSTPSQSNFSLRAPAGKSATGLWSSPEIRLVRKPPRFQLLLGHDPDRTVSPAGAA